MDWVGSLNRAIEYIEENLLDDVTCDKVARHVFISSFHLQRTFYLLTGFTLGEYVRNRRLTLAGQELSKGDARVIDVAMKYGYDTSESFSKAFSRFHGATPVQAKKRGTALKSFNRLTIKITMEGGIMMDYRIEKRDEFQVVVKVGVFGETSARDIPAFWDEYFAKGLHTKVPGAIGICGEEMEDGTFQYGIGSPMENAKGVPEEFEVWTVPANTWAVFKSVGAMPNAIQDLWKRIYSEWLPQSKYEMAKGYDFEYYTAGDTSSPDYISEIWIPVKEK